MVVGVTDGYKLQQELVGVGYRATNQGNTLDLVFRIFSPLCVPVAGRN
jgi:ribosomal protein L6P/L9E